MKRILTVFHLFSIFLLNAGPPSISEEVRGNMIVIAMNGKKTSLEGMRIYIEKFGEALIDSAKKFSFDPNPGRSLDQFHAKFLGAIPELLTANFSEWTMFDRHCLASEAHRIARKLIDYPDQQKQLMTLGDTLIEFSEQDKKWLSSPGDKKQYDQLTAMRNLRRFIFGVDPETEDGDVGDVVLDTINEAKFLARLTKSMALTSDDVKKRKESTVHKEEPEAPSLEFMTAFKSVVCALENVGKNAEIPHSQTADDLVKLEGLKYQAQEALAKEEQFTHQAETMKGMQERARVLIEAAKNDIRKAPSIIRVLIESSLQGGFFKEAVVHLVNKQYEHLATNMRNADANMKRAQSNRAAFLKRAQNAHADRVNMGEKVDEIVERREKALIAIREEQEATQVSLYTILAQMRELEAQKRELQKKEERLNRREEGNLKVLAAAQDVKGVVGLKQLT